MSPPHTPPSQVYFVAKQLAAPCSPEEFGLALVTHFLAHHPLVSRAKVRVTDAGWTRHHHAGAESLSPSPSSSQPHAHGFEGGGRGHRFAVVLADRSPATQPTVIAGLTGWRVLKTTQSGYAGFARDDWTALGETGDRILATSVSASWRYAGAPGGGYDGAFAAVTAALARAFFGPPTVGVFSPSAQFTLHEMGRAALDAEPSVDSIALTLPNLHFLPCAPLGDRRGFEDDVYVATSEPHGVIEATLVREGRGGRAVTPHVDLWGGDGLGPSARL